MNRDREYMERALELAAQGRGLTSPNPMVGCVVVREDRVLGEGYHERAGLPHAEVGAAEQAGDLAGATVYVTLEPCCHHGRTPPCVDLLREKGPTRVVVAMEDPNPLVKGKGVKALRDSGIQTDVGLLEEKASRLNEAFIKYVCTGMPFVTAKCGMSLDGKIATRTGDSRWVTGEVARSRVHALRNEVDAILIGRRTAEVDNPSLTTRLPGGSGKDPIRIILDPKGSLASGLQVFNHESNAPTWCVVEDGRAYDGADDVLRVPAHGDTLDMVALMKELGKREIASVLIEGGGTTLASAFAAGIVDKVLFFIAPKIVGGRDAVSAVEGLGAEHMDGVIELRDMTATPVGDDILIEAYVRGGEATSE